MSRPLAVLGVVICLALGVRVESVRRELHRPRDLHAVAERWGYAGAGECSRCHPLHAESFARTFHRTMTQDATDPGPRARLAPFDGSVLRYGGHEARFLMEGEARVVEVTDGTELRRYVVERTVGSHRYQQFLAREGDTFSRLPFAYHVEERRFFHMNEAFLTADPPGLEGPAPIARADYDRHVVRWNDNCVFCHNVAPSPGLDVATGRFETHVSELGVACEACHGPSGEHVALNADPVRRYLLHLTALPDPTVVSPERLTPERSADVCGRCHGQRITEEMSTFLAHGDPFVAGDDLALYSAPIFADSTLDGAPVFGPRFWDDGTPRLTAYEYQGLLMSRCAGEGELTCTSCHGMHEGDPAGQIRPGRRGDAMCTSCHAPAAPHPSSAPHTSVECTSCHMPDVVYGVRGVRVSHRIDVPRPAATEPGARPDACVLCHAELDAERGDGEAERGALFGLLFGGDPIQRSVAAAALETPVSGASDEVVRGWLREVMRSDPYPAVRAIAAASLRARGEVIAGISPTDGATVRATAIDAVGGPRPSAARVTELAERRSAAAIEIGE